MAMQKSVILTEYILSMSNVYREIHRNHIGIRFNPSHPDTLDMFDGNRLIGQVHATAEDLGEALCVNLYFLYEEDGELVERRDSYAELYE